MKRTWLATVFMLAFALVAAACTSGGDEGNTTGATGATGATGGGPVHLTMWVGYTPPPPENESHEYLSIERMVNEFEADNPDITIELQYVNSDNALQKATVAIQGDKQPDISYQYGTNMPQLAQSPALVDLTDRVNEGDYDWADFFPGEQAVATVDGKVLGVPALVDNLAVVYNKDLFAAAGVPEPTADWTWDDLRAAAAVARGHRVAGRVGAMVVPGSGQVKRQAEAEGLDRVFREAGFEWREAGCSMCLAMNPDKLEPGERCASTSNRNFEGRQGKGGRTHLVSPPMAAAAAIAGHLVDVRTFDADLAEVV